MDFKKQIEKEDEIEEEIMDAVNDFSEPLLESG